MKLLCKFLLIISCSFGIGNIVYGLSNPMLEGPGRLKSYQLGASYSIAEIKAQAYRDLCNGLDPDSSQCKENLAKLKADYNFNISQLNSGSPQTSGVKVYNITYTSEGLSKDGKMQLQPRVVSGALIVPQGLPVDKIKGVILYFNHTTYAPNEYGPEANLKNSLSFPALYALNGYIVVRPDGLGFGLDSQEMHPYIYPQVTVLNGLNMLRSTNEALAKLGLKSNKPLNLIINGFSEGGFVSAWATRMIYQHPELLAGIPMQLKLTVAMSGVYDFENVQLPLEYSNLSTEPGKNQFRIENQEAAAIAKPGLITYAVASFLYYNPQYKCSDILAAGFCNFTSNNSNLTNVAQVFESQFKYSTPEIQDLLYRHAHEMAESYSYNNNSVSLITQKELLTSFRYAMYRLYLEPWKVETPITFIHLNRDSLVSPLNSINAFHALSNMSDKGMVRQIEINNDNYKMTSGKRAIDHNNPIQYIAALAIFRELR